MAVILACLPDVTFSFSMDLDAIRMSEGIDDEKRRLSIPVMRSTLRGMRNPELANLHQKKNEPSESDSLLVPRVGLEPTRPNGHMALNHACLPISAPGRCKD